MEGYKKRQLAEMLELEDRLDKLNALLYRNEHGGLGFELSCPVELLKDQARYMEGYLRILKERAAIEGVPCPE